MQSLPVRVVVFASEQLFPTLQFLLHTADQFGDRLRSIHIYCTDDERRSKAPAKRLKEITELWGKSKAFHFFVEITEGGMWPDDVRTGLGNWFAANLDSEWLINVTGGTKPMSAAAIEFALSVGLPALRVIYFEINGAAVEMLRDHNGHMTTKLLSAIEDRSVPLSNTLERLLAVEDLVQTQFSAQHQITAQDLLPLDVGQATKKLIASKWKWKDALLALNVPTISGGDAFERYVGAGLLAFGVQLKHSLKVLDGSKVVLEVDLVGCHNSRLVCIDIKLPGAEEKAKVTQLADISDRARSLGGSNAIAIALRPGWAEDKETQALAKALNVRLLTQAQAPRIFSTIMGWIDPKQPLPMALFATESLLQAAQINGQSVLSDGSIINAAPASESGVLNLVYLVTGVAERQKTCWALVQLMDATQYLLVISKKSPFAPPDWGAALEKVQVVLGQHVNSGKNGDTKLNQTNSFAYGQFGMPPGVKLLTVQAALRGIFPVAASTDASND